MSSINDDFWLVFAVFDFSQNIGFKASSSFRSHTAFLRINLQQPIQRSVSSQVFIFVSSIAISLLFLFLGCFKTLSYLHKFTLSFVYCLFPKLFPSSTNLCETWRESNKMDNKIERKGNTSKGNSRNRRGNAKKSKSDLQAIQRHRRDSQVKEAKKT